MARLKAVRHEDRLTLVEHLDELRTRLIELQDQDLAGVYVEVMVSPSMRSVLAQALQVPGVSGLENNAVLFELCREDRDEVVDTVLENARFAAIVGRSVLVLRHSEAGFGKRRTVHLWLTWDDEPHAALMVMLAYVLLGHRDWRHAKIHVFAALPSDRIDEAHARFLGMIAGGRLPISPKNIHFLPFDSEEEFHGAVEARSSEADLVLRALSVREEAVWIYGAIFLLSFLFTFGPEGPYLYLHRYVPGFDGLRVADAEHRDVLETLTDHLLQNGHRILCPAGSRVVGVIEQNDRPATQLLCTGNRLGERLRMKDELLALPPGCVQQALARRIRQGLVAIGNGNYRQARVRKVGQRKPTEDRRRE